MSIIKDICCGKTSVFILLNSIIFVETKYTKSAAVIVRQSVALKETPTTLAMSLLGSAYWGARLLGFAATVS